MAAQKDVLGLIHAGREIRRPPLVGMQFLHQRAVRAPDVLGARPRLHAKDLIGLLFRHFAAGRSRPAPLPRHPPRVHARRASRRSRYAISSARLSSSISVEQAEQRLDIERIERRALVAAGKDTAAHRAGVVVEFHLEEGRAHARGLAGAFLRALRKTSRRRTAASRAARARRRRAESRSRFPRADRETRQSRCARMPPTALITRAALCGSALAKTLSAHSTSTSTTTPKRIASAWLSHLREELDRAAVAPRRQVGQRAHAAGGVGRDRAQQLAELMRRAGVEAAIGAARQPRDLAKRLLGDRDRRPPGT